MVKCNPGKENSVADALSRRLQFSAVSTVQFFEWDGVEDELKADDKMKKVLQELVEDPDYHSGFQLKLGRLLYKGRMVLAKWSARISMLLREFHDFVSGGHSGFFCAYKRIAALVYWEGMK